MPYKDPAKRLLHSRWRGMHRRCETHEAYIAKGIGVCTRWDSFENFAIDMGNPPNGYTLDRINNDGHYSPQNCRWATVAEQNRNQGRNKLVTANGKTMVIADWAIELGIDRSTLRDRIARGMAPEEAVLMPKQVETTAVPVHQIDLAGNLVREYESLGAVGRTLTPHCPDNGKKGVSAVLHNKRSTYKGYKWEYSKTTQLCAIIDEWT